MSRLSTLEPVDPAAALTPIEQLLSQAPSRPPAPPAGHRPYKPVGRLGGWVQGMFAGQALADVAGLAVARHALTDGVAKNEVAAVHTAIALAVVACAVATVRWAHRITANLPALGAEDPPFTAREAVAWFLVPGANLVGPPRVLAAAAKASQPGYPAGSTLWRSSPAMPLIWVWWVFSVTTRVLGVAILIKASHHDLDRHSFLLSAPCMFGITALEVVSMALSIAVVRRITHDHRSRATRLARRGQLVDGCRDFQRT